MTQGNIAKVGFLRCAQCAGVWIGAQALASLLDSSSRAPDLSEMVTPSPGGQGKPCLYCQSSMELLMLSHLELERCREHGFWLDPEELQRALAGNIGPDAPEEGPYDKLSRALLEDLVS